MNNSKKTNVKETVRNVYSSISRGANQSCCGSSNADLATSRLGYSPEIINDIPDGANLGLGCGNPIELASIKGGETVLDLGSGAGFDCFIAAREVGESVKVIGVDMTPGMIEKARENARKAGIENVEFRLGEIEHLPAADNSIDIVISNCVVNLAEDKEAVYREVFRVLKPGGRLAISDILAKIPLPDEVKQDSELVAGCIGGAITASELRPFIEKAGFTDISISSKNNSDDIVSGWQPGSNIAELVFSAYISARKPSTDQEGA